MSLLQHTGNLQPKSFLGVSIIFFLGVPSLAVCTHTTKSMTVAISEQHCSWNPSASTTKGLQRCILLRALQRKRELTCCRCSVESLSYFEKYSPHHTKSHVKQVAKACSVELSATNLSKPRNFSLNCKIPFVCTVDFTFQQIWKKISCHLKALLCEESSSSSSSSWQPGCKGKDLLCRKRSAGLCLFLGLLTWETKIYSAARHKDLKIKDYLKTLCIKHSKWIQTRVIGFSSCD